MEWKWTDEKVRDFVKVATMGSWGEYAGLKTLESKMEYFKENYGGSE